MEYNYFSKRNPFFRKNLVNYIIGLNLKNIEFFYSKDIPKVNQHKIIHDGSDSITLVFENDFKVSLGYMPVRFLEIQEVTNEDFTWIIYPDKLSRISYGLKKVSNTLKISLKDDWVGKVIGQKVTQVYLLKETPKFIENYRLNQRNLLCVRGICLEFGDRELSIYFIPFKNIIVDFDKKALTSNLLTKSTSFYQNGKTVRSLSDDKIFIPIVNLTDKIIQRENMLSTSFLMVHSLQPISIDIDILYKMFNLHKFNVQKQIKFLKDLKKDMIEYKYGIAEIKIGLDRLKNFKLIMPIDIILYNEEDITLIDSIIQSLLNLELLDLHS